MAASDEKSLAQAAERLLPAAQILATSSYTTVASAEELVYSIPTERWDVVLSVAGVSFALYSLDMGCMGDEAKKRSREIVLECLDQTDPPMLDALHDCRSFVKRAFAAVSDAQDSGLESVQHIADSFGSWIVWNLVEHAPESESERRLVRQLGILVDVSFRGWWASDTAATTRIRSASDIGLPKRTLGFRFGQWVRDRLIGHS